MRDVRDSYRYGLQRIVEHPNTEVTHEAECLWCNWTHTSTDSAAVDLECISHAGLSGHRGFRRILTSFSMAVRVE